MHIQLNCHIKEWLELINHTHLKFCWCDTEVAAYFCRSLNHWTARFLWAFLSRVSVSSYSWKLAEAKTWRSKTGSIAFVNASATWREVGIHRKEQCSLHLSRLRSTSNVVRNSSQDGIAVRLTRSNKLLQSVTIMVFGRETPETLLSVSPVKSWYVDCAPQKSHPS